MSMQGARKRVTATPIIPKRQMNENLLSDSDNGIHDFGADILAECFGTPEEQEESPSTLLWLANGLYAATSKIVEVVTTCRIRPR